MAVYTDVDSGELATFLAHYELGEVRAFKGIAEGVENSNFYLSTQKGEYILTLFEKRVNANDLPYFMDLMTHLSAKKLPVPLPQKNKEGEVLGQLCGKNAVLVDFLQGVSVRKPSIAHCKQLGAHLAKMHLALADFEPKRANTMQIQDWRQLLETLSLDDARLPANTLAYALEMQSKIEKEWPQKLPLGTVHGDLFPNNVLFLKDRLSGLIDFYFSAYDMLSFDLAICLNAWCFEQDASYNLTKGQALLNAYTQIRPLTLAEKDAFPTLCRGAAMRFLSTRLVDFVSVPQGAIVKPHDPNEYYKKLQFHADIVSPRAYGLNG